MPVAEPIKDQILTRAISTIVREPAFSSEGLFFRSWADGYDQTYEASTEKSPKDVGFHMRSIISDVIDFNREPQNPLISSPIICTQWLAFHLYHDPSGRNLQEWRDWYEKIQPQSTQWINQFAPFIVQFLIQTETFLNRSRSRI